MEEEVYMVNTQILVAVLDRSKNISLVTYQRYKVEKWSLGPSWMILLSCFIFKDLKISIRTFYSTFLSSSWNSNTELGHSRSAEDCRLHIDPSDFWGASCPRSQDENNDAFSTMQDKAVLKNWNEEPGGFILMNESGLTSIISCSLDLSKHTKATLCYMLTQNISKSVC